MPTRDRIARSSVPSTLATLGDGWTLLMLTALVGGRQRFSALEQALGVPRSTLAARLRHLEEHGLVARHAYEERPPRFEYALTERGASLLPVLALADAFDVSHGGATARLWHQPARGPAHPLLAQAHCDACGRLVSARQVTVGYLDHAPPLAAAQRGRETPRATRARSTRQPYRHARDVLEDAWAAKTVAALLMGERRFTGLQHATQAAPNILSERLGRLVESGLLRHVSDDGQAPAYQLSARVGSRCIRWWSR
ncbi:MAG: winged helix-turn-helix transcriptional regulator [Sandaracinaceae bacterium]|nr:winged helix-turn-helix transcriptional regulator [Sandaracinaceae bacterium]